MSCLERGQGVGVLSRGVGALSREEVWVFCPGGVMFREGGPVQRGWLTSNNHPPPFPSVTM